MRTLACEQLLLDGRLTGPVAVGVDGGRVASVEHRGPRPGDEVLDGALLTAGMVDLQVNGAGGVDLATAEPGDWDAIAAHLAGHGVTAFCPTFITAPVERLAALVAGAARARAALGGRPVAQPAGVHVEGPFLAPSRVGAHPPELIREPTPELLDALLAGAAPGDVAIVTLAPELPGADAAIARLRALGIAVSIGHSDATAEQAAAAAGAGAALVTHLFNAQRPFRHRDPGLPGHALVDRRLVCGLIADLHHVAPDAVRLAFAAAPGRIALVSDAVSAAGMGAGEFRHGPLTIFGHATGPATLADGTLAGSALHLDEAVRNVAGLGVDPAVALTAATATPARALGRRGEVAAGERADLVLWDEELRVRAVWVGGEAVARR